MNDKVQYILLLLLFFALIGSAIWAFYVCAPLEALGW